MGALSSVRDKVALAHLLGESCFAEGLQHHFLATCLGSCIGNCRSPLTYAWICLAQFGRRADLRYSVHHDCRLQVEERHCKQVQLWKGSVAGILQFLQHRGSHHGGCHLRIVWMYFHTGPSRLCFGEWPISVHISVQCLFEDVRWICAAVGSRESSHKDVYDSRKWCNLVLKRASHDVPNSVCTKVHR